jgi:apolipoprotein D and lipocalin family protein
MRSLVYSLLLFTIALAGCGSNQKVSTMRTVSEVNLERYMGTWYEIARFPHSFERNLVGVTATYRLKENGKVEVINQGYLHTLDGKLKKAKAFAKVPNPQEPARLKVYFFWPFGADYLILDLAPDYTWALVGSSSPNYLWILSRTPQMEPQLYNDIVQKAQSLGYDISKLELVEQKPQE